MQAASLLHATENHTSQLADFTLRVFLDHLLQTLGTSPRVALIEQAETFDEQELGTVLT